MENMMEKLRGTRTEENLRTGICGGIAGAEQVQLLCQQSRGGRIQSDCGDFSHYGDK